MLNVVLVSRKWGKLLTFENGEIFRACSAGLQHDVDSSVYC